MLMIKVTFSVIVSFGAGAQLTTVATPPPEIKNTATFEDQGVNIAESSGIPAGQGSGDDQPAAPVVAVRKCAQTQPGSFCQGTSECVTTRAPKGPDGKFINEAHLTTTIGPDAGSQPTPDAPLFYTTCTDPAGQETMSTFWQTPTQAQILAQARTAVARLPFPRTTLAYTAKLALPQGLTLVNTPTHWYVPNGSTQTLQSPPAGSLRAQATATTISITPGDDSPTITCPWSPDITSTNSSCTHEYQKPSVNGNYSYTFGSGQTQPAYQASATITWTITFTQNGRPITLPNLPTTQDGQKFSTIIPVGELQTTVTSPS